MKLIFKAVFVFSILLAFTSEAYSICYNKEKAHRKYVVKSDLYKKDGKYDEAETALKKYLKCYPEKEVFLKLANLFEYQRKYYLAGITYKNAGMEAEYNELEKRRLLKITTQTLSNVDERINSLAEKYSKTGHDFKNGAMVLFSIGSALAIVGGGIFISNKAFDGNTSELIQYSLLIGGFSIIGAGFSTNFNGDHYINTSESLKNFNIKQVADLGTTSKEYFVYSGAESNAKKMSAKSLRNAGIFMLAVSIPIFTFSMFSLFDEYGHIFKSNGQDEALYSSGDYFTIFAVKGFLMPPAFLFMLRGAIMLAKASKYKKLDTKPDTLTLTSVTPVINPVSKTYGLALGFSF